MKTGYWAVVHLPFARNADRPHVLFQAKPKPRGGCDFTLRHALGVFSQWHFQPWLLLENRWYNAFLVTQSPSLPAFHTARDTTPLSSFLSLDFWYFETGFLSESSLAALFIKKFPEGFWLGICSMCQTSHGIFPPGL